MERLKASFVKTKRRLAERAFQAAGIHEASETAEGLAFQDALRRYDALVRSFRDVEECMKEHLILWHALAESQHRMARQINATFQGGGGAMEELSARNVASNEVLLNDFEGVKKVYLEHVLHPTAELLKKSLPEIQRLVEKRSSLKLDYDSYAVRGVFARSNYYFSSNDFFEPVYS